MTARPIILEIIALDASDATLAAAAGADRLELVRDIDCGGLTPAAACVEAVVQAGPLPVMVMVRPHARSFVYDAADMAQIRRDIDMARRHGAHGVVFGSLTADGQIHQEQLRQVLQWATGLSVTFHRAFDAATDLPQAYRVLTQHRGALARVLSSGGASTALAGADTLTRLHSLPWGLPLLAGAGINADNLPMLHRQVKASEYHVGSGARQQADFRQPLDPAAIARMRRYLDDASNS